MKIKITIADTVKDNRILPEDQMEFEWKEIVLLLSTNVVSPTKNTVPMIVPVEFTTIDETNEYAKVTAKEAWMGDYWAEGTIKKDNNGNPYVWKSNVNIKKWYMLPVDVDGNMTINEAVEKFKDYEYVLYTSHSHQSDAKPYDCFRMFFPLSTPIEHHDFLSRRPAMEVWLEKLDLSSLASFRAFYLPSCPKEREQLKVFRHNKGQLVDPHSFDVFVKPEPKYTTIRLDCDDKQKQHILNLCLQLGNLDYGDWFNNVCLPMIDGGFSEHDFVGVSTNIRSHRSGDAANASKHWKAGLSTSTGGSKKTIGSLIWFLKDRLGDDCMDGYYETRKEKIERFESNLDLKTKLEAKIAELKNKY